MSALSSMDAARSNTVELSIPLPRSPDTRIYMRLSTQAKALMISLTTATADEVSAAKPMGSFVYAMPDRFNEKQPLATTLFTAESTLEFTTRYAKLVARRTKLPVYVTNSMSFANAGMGGTIEEEMEAFRNIVEISLAKLQEKGVGALAVNGTSVVNGVPKTEA